jgi:hypothetical protein
MSFYIGVLVFCLQNQGCYFLKINENFDKIEQCQKAVRQWDQYARKEGLETEMACLEVTLKPNV